MIQPELVFAMNSVIFFFATALVVLKDTFSDFPKNLVLPSVIDLVEPADN